MSDEREVRELPEGSAGAWTEPGVEDFAGQFTIERDPEDGMVWITHRYSSLVGCGKDLEAAARDLSADMPGIFAVYAGRDDLSARAAQMVAWLARVGGFRIDASDPPTPPTTAPEGGEAEPVAWMADCGDPDCTASPDVHQVPFTFEGEGRHGE